MRKRESEGMEEVNEIKEEGGEEGYLEEEEPVEDFGPNFDPTFFTFLTQQSTQSFYEGSFEILRPCKTTLGFLENPHGSVKLFQGDTCVVCAVYGPSEVRIAKELPHRAAVDVLFRPKITGTSHLTQLTGWDSIFEERAVEVKLTGILESVIFLEDDLGAGFNVILHEFENDGCLFAACVNATALALLNAGCSLRSCFAAVTVLITKTNTVIVDPSLGQINKGWEGILNFVFTNDGNILHSSLQGKTTPALLKLCMLQARKASVEVFRFQKLVQLKECSYFSQKSKGEQAGLDSVKVKQEPGISEDVSDVEFKLENVKLEQADDDEDDDDEEDGSESSYSDIEDGEVVSVSD